MSEISKLYNRFIFAVTASYLCKMLRTRLYHRGEEELKNEQIFPSNLEVVYDFGLYNENAEVIEEDTVLFIVRRRRYGNREQRAYTITWEDILECLPTAFTRKTKYHTIRILLERYKLSWEFDCKRRIHGHTLIFGFY